MLRVFIFLKSGRILRVMSSYRCDDNAGGYMTATSAATGKPKRRRVIHCVEPEDDASVETYYADDPKTNDPLRYTTCMSHHIMARIEDDVKRAKMREENPESAIPSKGYEYDVDAYRAVEEYKATQQLPRGSNVVAAVLYTPPRTDVFLPAISPPSTRSRRNSNSTSRQPSRGNSTANSPSNQSRHGGPPQASARRRGQSSRTSSQVSQYPSVYRSRSSSKHANNSNNGSVATISSSPQPRLPAGGRLQPLDQADPTPPLHNSGFRDDGRVTGLSDQPSKANTKLFLEPESLEDEEAATTVDAERQRRLRLAEQLAQQMEAEGM